MSNLDVKCYFYCALAIKCKQVICRFIQGLVVGLYRIPVYSGFGLDRFHWIVI